MDKKTSITHADDIVNVIGEKIKEKKFDRSAFVNLKPLLGNFN